MSPEIRPAVRNFRQRAAYAVEKATRAYFATDPKSIRRIDRIIEVEDLQRIGQFMGVPIDDIVRASLRGTPKQYQQDYLDSIYDWGVLTGNESKDIAREFKLLPTTLIATSLSWSPDRKT